VSQAQKQRAIALVILIGGFVLGYWYFQQEEVITTENAYIKSEHVYVSAQVSGAIVEVVTGQHEPVQAGDVLFYIDPSLFKARVSRLEASLQAVGLEIQHMKQGLQELEAQRALVLENLRYAREELDREQSLVGRGLNTERELASRQHELNLAQRNLNVVEANIEAALVDLQFDPDLPVESHPKYKAVLEDLAQARQDLAKTEVRAPIDGLITDKPVVGTYAERGRAITSLIDVNKVWVEANFLETELANISVGDTARILVEAYPGEVWEAKVTSLSPATGAEFAILPPQNATGNWVKITQRVPVRLDLASKAGEGILRKGMTASVRVYPSGYSEAR
jgi:membrane fusion protein (multidrug efflux system)